VSTRVLVIDDDIDMTDLLKIVLDPAAFEVTVANSGSEGVKLAREFNPDVVILDLLMPDMDGWEVCKNIREFSQVPILVLSAISKPGLAARALDDGADDFLLKPMPTGVLVAHIKKLARRSESRVKHSLKTGLNYAV
jgi:DNA-binding response OmpR family regulator